MTELCLDASVAVKLVFQGEPLRAQARKLLQECLTKRVALIVPPFFENEVDSAVCRRVFEGRMTSAQAQQAYAGLDRLVVQSMNYPEVRQRARVIADQFAQRRVYDSTYAALAEFRGCEFWTADKSFYDTVRVVLPFVKYLGDYPA